MKRYWWEDELEARTQPIYEPRNTFSNVAYPLAALATGDPFFIAAMLLLGVGSAYMHGWHTRLGHALDIAGMYAVFAMLVVPLGSVGLFGWLMGFTLTRFRWARVSVNYVMGMTLAVSFLLSLNAFAVLALLLYVVAYGFWTAGKDRWVMLPTLRLWNHAIWHVLTAVATTVMYHARTL